nr:unnamed protein product [Callosobruchus chinensis]
MHIQRSYCIAN